MKKTDVVKRKGARQVSERARKAATIIAENPEIGHGAALAQAGFSTHSVTHPSRITGTESFQDLLDEYMPHRDVLAAHKSLLMSATLEKVILDNDEAGLTDKQIKESVKASGCTLRNIVHHKATGKRYVYYFAPDNRARKDALDMVYKLRGSYAAEKHDVRHFSLLGLGKKRDEMIDGNKDITVIDTAPPAIDAP